MRFRLEHVRSKKGPAGARFSKVPVTERTPKAVLFSFPLLTNTDEWNATKFYDNWHFFHAGDLGKNCGHPSQ